MFRGRVLICSAYLHRSLAHLECSSIAIDRPLKKAYGGAVLHRFPSHGRQAYSGRRATNLDLDQGHNHTSAHASAAAKAPREFWTGPAATMLAQLQTSPAGLSSAEAAARL